MNNTYSSRAADKFIVRLPDGLRDRVDALAQQDATSMNAMFVQAVNLLLDGRARQALLLDALEQAIMTKSDPVAAYARINPEGYPEHLLARRHGSFVDTKVRGSYLKFLAGYRAAQGIEP